MIISFICAFIFFILNGCDYLFKIKELGSEKILKIINIIKKVNS